MQKWLADFTASYFQEKAPSKMFDSFLDVFLNSIVMLLYYQYYYSFSFIYFVILSFPCNIILALNALSELLCVIIIQHFFWCWASFLLTMDNVLLYFISFLSHPFIRHSYVQSQFIHLFYSTFYAVFMCSYWHWMIQCHFIVLTIILIIYPW